MIEEVKDDVYPILLLGDSKVGKTCFLLRYCTNMFQESHLTTMGLDFKLKEIDIDSNKVTVKLWDTTGQERFKSLTRSFYRNVLGIALMYDVTKKESFDNIAVWVSQIKDKAAANIQVILIGNKIDAIDEREVSTEEGQKLGEKYHLPVFEASAKDDVNVEESIRALVTKIYQNKLQNDSNIDLKRKKKKEGCCG